MAEGKNFCLQNGMGSEAISQREKQSEHGLEKINGRGSINATISMRTAFLVVTRV
jgi:hypothetical protein